MVVFAALETVGVSSVHDTGIGIPAEKIDTIFDPFVQVEQRLSQMNQAVGVGLSISRALARGMSGDLTVESAPERGSTFTLILPRSAHARAEC